MTIRKLAFTILTVTLMGGVCAGLARRALADKPAGGAGGAAGVAAPTNCKVFGSGQCCDPVITAHLPKEAVFKACGESDATFLGEAGSKETCKYMFKAEGGDKPDEAFVQVYAPTQKEVPSTPNDPFFQWKKIGKAFLADKAKSPKAAPMIANATGLWMPGKGYFVSVNASSKVCSKAEATKLAPSIK
jgi:hypothetical protein